MLVRNSTVQRMFRKQEAEYCSKTEPEIVAEREKLRGSKNLILDRSKLRAKELEKYKKFLNDFSKECEEKHGIKNALYGCKTDLVNDYIAYLKEMLVENYWKV